MLSRRIALVSLVVLAVPLGCDPAEDDDDQVPVQIVVGRVDGTEAFIGIAMDGDRVFAYVCDGTPAAGTTLSAWFVAAPGADSFAGSNPSGATLEGTIGDGSVTGTLVGSNGVSRGYTASAAAGISGLYFGELDADMPTEAWGGWIVDGGAQRGAVVDVQIGDIVGSPSINPAPTGTVDVDGKALAFEQLDAPLEETVDELPPGG